MHASKRSFAPGEQITYAVPDTSATVTMHRTDNGHTGRLFLVYVAQGAYRPDGWTYTYADETTARFEATRAATLLQRYGTADRIEARRDHLAGIVGEQDARAVRGMHNPATLAAARAELDSLLTFADMAALVRLRADLAVYSTPAA
jgi:hypothetical protein